MNCYIPKTVFIFRHVSGTTGILSKSFSNDWSKKESEITSIRSHVPSHESRHPPRLSLWGLRTLWRIWCHKPRKLCLLHLNTTKTKSTQGWVRNPIRSRDGGMWHFVTPNWRCLLLYGCRLQPQDLSVHQAKLMRNSLRSVGHYCMPLPDSSLGLETEDNRL